MSSVPRMVPLRWIFLPPIVFGLTYQGEGFRQQLLQCCSALRTRLQLFRQGTCQGGKRMPERHGTAWATPGSWGILAKQKNSMDFVWRFFFQQNADHTTHIPEGGSCGSYGILAGFLFLSVFSFFWCFRQGFLKQETPSAKQPTQKNTLILRPLTKFIVGFCFHLLLQSIDGLVGAIWYG